MVARPHALRRRPVRETSRGGLEDLICTRSELPSFRTTGQPTLSRPHVVSRVLHTMTVEVNGRAVRKLLTFAEKQLTALNTTVT
jgi:hypothetical protein